MAKIITKESKPGKGVPKDLPEKRRFFQFFEIYFSKFSKFLQLNCIYFVCLLPLIMGIYYSLIVNPLIDSPSEILDFPLFVLTPTLKGLVLLVISAFITGPATAGFTYVIRNIQRKEHSWIFSDFFEHFKKNYKQGICMSWLDLICYILLYVAFAFYIFILPKDSPEIGQIIPVLGAIFVGALTIVYTWMHYYIYTMMVTFKLDFDKLFKNALIFSIAKLPLNLLISAIIIVIIALLIWSLSVTSIILGILLPTLLLSFIGLIIIFSTYPVIDKNMIQQANKRVLNTRG